MFVFRGTEWIKMDSYMQKLIATLEAKLIRQEESVKLTREQLAELRKLAK